MYFASMTACTPVKFVVKSSIALCVFSLIISGWLKSRRGSKDSKILCLNAAVRPIACSILKMKIISQPTADDYKTFC